MTAQSRSRDATATIRGYMYQFDATIRAILKMPNGEQLDVEGLEDFDIGGDDPTALYQCKYYAAQTLTPSELRDAILPMLKGFLALDGSARKHRRYHLYGYYKDSTPGVSQRTLQELQAALVQRKQVKTSSGKIDTQKINIQEKLGATDADLKLFAELLTIHIGEEYGEHKRQTVAELKAALSVTEVEAKEHLYPTALSMISALATGDTLAKRRTTKDDFCSQLLPSRTLLSAWLLRELGHSAFCRDMRQRHFSKQNIDALQRFFIVDCNRPVPNADLLSLLHTLRRKWSTHTVRRKPAAERYAPYVYLRGLGDGDLVALKLGLQEEGVMFVDGYAFAGACFSAAQVAQPQTYPGGVSLRFLNSEADLLTTLSSVTGQRCAYEFFIDEPLAIRTDVRYTAFPVNSIPMIERIV